jgi:DNA-binding beta-propeller fold protein YncE
LSLSPITNIGSSFYLSVDSSGSVYATQFSQHTVILVSPQAAVSTIAGSGIAGSANGIGTNAQFNYPLGIAIDSVGSAIFICDQDNQAIRR